MCRGRVGRVTTVGVEIVVWAGVVAGAIPAVAGVVGRMNGAAVVVGVVVLVASTDYVVVMVELVVPRTSTAGSAGTFPAMGSCIGTGIGIGAGIVGDGGGEGFLLRFLFFVWRCFVCFLCRLWDEEYVSHAEEDEDEVSEEVRWPPTARCTKTRSRPSIRAGVGLLLRRGS